MPNRWLGGISAALFAGVITWSIAGSARHLTGILILKHYGQTTADQVADVAIAFEWVVTIAVTTLAFWWAYHSGWPVPKSKQDP